MEMGVYNLLNNVSVWEGVMEMGVYNLLNNDSVCRPASILHHSQNKIFFSNVCKNKLAISVSQIKLGQGWCIKIFFEFTPTPSL